MNKRKEQLLKLVIENYIQTAEPVGSNFLVTQAGLELSGATVRNELRDLEETGFLTHPHTSAGRIPTEIGYKYYIEQILKAGKITEKTKENLLQNLGQISGNEEKIKILAKNFSAISANAVIVAFDKDRVYYTGISSLFAQPEFKDYALTVNVSSIFDHCEDCLDDVYKKIDQDGVKILLGQDNPLGKMCSFIAVRFNENSMLGILGPLRMDYAKNLGLMELVKELLN